MKYLPARLPIRNLVWEYYGSDLRLKLAGRWVMTVRCHPCGQRYVTPAPGCPPLATGAAAAAFSAPAAAKLYAEIETLAHI